MTYWALAPEGVARGTTQIGYVVFGQPHRALASSRDAVRVARAMWTGARPRARAGPTVGVIDATRSRSSASACSACLPAGAGARGSTRWGGKR